MDIHSTVALNNGVAIPRIGLGVYKTAPGRETEEAVLGALEAGYRHIDTAAIYRNEESVGTAIKKSLIPRAEVFITTKLWNDDQHNPAAALDQSLAKLQTDFVDLYLMHWPVEGTRLAAWKVMEQLYHRGACRSIGVSNFTIRHVEELLREIEVVPSVNQVEFSPYLYQERLLSFCRSMKIQLEAYSPLTRGKRLNDPQLRSVAQHYSKSPAQVLIRWALQHNLVVIPKSRSPRRIRENADVFDFVLSREDMELLNGLHEEYRTCWNPETIP